MPNDSDLERIKARIRGQRFILADKRWMLLWSFCIGAACGATLGVWMAVSKYYDSMASGATGGLSFALLVEGLIISSVLGLVGGGGLATTVVGLVRFFHPTYVALRYSPEEFERQYGDRPPKIG